MGQTRAFFRELLSSQEQIADALHTLNRTVVALFGELESLRGEWTLAADALTKLEGRLTLVENTVLDEFNRQGERLTNLKKDVERLQCRREAEGTCYVDLSSPTERS